MRFFAGCRFSVRLTFRALQPNGVLLTLLSSERVATEYLVVYMSNGHLVVTMVSSSRSMDTRELRSRYKYNDANWWQVLSTKLHCRSNDSSSSNRNNNKYYYSLIFYTTRTPYKTHAFCYTRDLSSVGFPVG